MRCDRSSALAAAAVLVLAITVAGDSRANLIVARIGFEWVVGDRPCPAGEYLGLFPVPSHAAALTSGSRSSEAHTVTLAARSDPRFSESRASVEFRHYTYEDPNGNRLDACFLFLINAGRGMAGREMSRSAGERQRPGSAARDRVCGGLSVAAASVTLPG